MLSKIKNIYYNKWFPRIFFKKHDGGKESGVTGYMLIEWKPLFSIGFLHFKEGSREAYHTHAFNALTWWLKGAITEERLVEDVAHFRLLPTRKEFTPSTTVKFTSRDNLHKVIAHKSSWAFTLRGPWKDTWQEKRPDGWVTLTHGRKII